MFTITKVTRQLTLILIVLLQFGLVRQGYSNGETSTLDDLRSSLNEAGNYRLVYCTFFSLYDSVLYTNAEQTSIIDEVLNGENALLLQFDFLRKIRKAIILEASEKHLTINMSPAELASIRKRVDQLNSVFRTLDKGDSLALSYIPDKGTTLWINGKSMTTIEGKDFARLYYRIWLGKRPISRPMRNALLQRAIVKR